MGGEPGIGSPRCGASISAMWLILVVMWVAWGTVSANQVHAQSQEKVHIRINVGGPTVDGWVSDKVYARGGNVFKFPGGHDLSGVQDSPPESVYHTVRHSDHSFLFPNLPNGHFLVRFHFSEGAIRSDDRHMEFELEGETAIKDFSPKQAAGGEKKKAVVREVEVEVTDGNGLRIDCRRGTGDDVYESALEVVQLSTPIEDLTRSERIQAFTGRRTKVAWMQTPHHTDWYGVMGQGSVMVLDTADGEGERLLFENSGGASKPMITPDGEQVIFTDQLAHRVYAIPFEGGAPVEITEGFGAEVWRDPETNLDWVYARTSFLHTKATLFRVRLDNPSIRENVIASVVDIGAKGAPWLQLSQDGRRATEAFPWPKCGVIAFPNGKWQVHQNGCWPSMSPDNSYRFFIFKGDHKEATMFDADGKNPRSVRLNQMLVNHNQKVYHPRWSNHPRYLTVTAPFQLEESEVYLGKFAEDFNSVSGWVQVSDNEQYDFFGDAWIEPESAQMTKGMPPVLAVSPQGALQKQGLEWPISTRDMVVLWGDAVANNLIERPDGTFFTCLGEMTGRARFTRHLGVDLGGGGFDIAADRKEWERRFRQSDSFSLELGLELTAESKYGRLIAFGPTERTKVIVDVDDGRTLTIRTLGKKEVGPYELGRLEIDRPVHLAMEFTDDKLRWWWNGDLAGEQKFIPSKNFPSSRDIRFGDGKLQAHVERIAAYARRMDSSELEKHAQIYKEQVKERKPVPAVKVEAKLVEQTVTPSPKAIAPYRRCMVENLYEIQKVESGDLDNQRIVVTQWAILDGRVLKKLPKLGETYSLTLQPFATRPELAGERRVSDLTVFDLPVWHDIAVPGRWEN